MTRSPVRWAVLIAVAGAAVRFWLAAATVGTSDVLTFQHFAEVIRAVGPVRIYEIPNPGGEWLYNHPPLTGFLLVLVDRAAAAGVPFHLAIKTPACLADTGTTLLVFAMLRRRRGPRVALAGATVVAASPILIAVSGFHGNTDPVFVLLTLLAAYLLADRRHALLAGAALGAALGIKIVPVVLVPAFLLAALRAGRKQALALIGGMGAVLALTWGPAVLTEWVHLRANVLEYAGVYYRAWGLLEIGQLLHVPAATLNAIADAGRFAVVGLAALVCAVLAWRAPDRLPAVVGIGLGLTLLLSTATGLQYLAWPAAALCLSCVRTAALYNLTGGALLASVYHRVYRGQGATWTVPEIGIGLAAWAALALALGVGLYRVARRPHPDPVSPGHLDALTRSG